MIPVEATSQGPGDRAAEVADDAEPGRVVVAEGPQATMTPRSRPRWPGPARSPAARRPAGVSAERTIETTPEGRQADPGDARRSGRSPSQIRLSGIVQTEAVHWRKIALAAVVALIEPMYRPVITPKTTPRGIMAGAKVRAAGGPRGATPGRRTGRGRRRWRGVEVEPLGDRPGQAPQRRRSQHATPARRRRFPARLGHACPFCCRRTRPGAARDGNRIRVRVEAPGAAVRVDRSAGRR